MKAIKKTVLFLVAIITLASLNSCFYRVDGHRRWGWHHHDFHHPSPGGLNNNNNNDDDYCGLNNYLDNNTATTVSIDHTDTITLSPH
jgi:hypothetical protein